MGTAGCSHQGKEAHALIRIYSKPISYMLHHNGDWCAELQCVTTDRAHALADTYFHLGYNAFVCVLDHSNDPFELCPNKHGRG
jgi:hypothetical protein